MEAAYGAFYIFMKEFWYWIAGFNWCYFEGYVRIIQAM